MSLPPRLVAVAMVWVLPSVESSQNRRNRLACLSKSEKPNTFLPSGDHPSTHKSPGSELLNSVRTPVPSRLIIRISLPPWSAPLKARRLLSGDHHPNSTLRPVV